MFTLALHHPEGYPGRGQLQSVRSVFIPQIGSTLSTDEGVFKVEGVHQLAEGSRMSDTIAIYLVTQD